MLPAPPKPWTHLTKPLRAHSRTLPSPCKGRPHKNPSDPVLNPSQASQKQLKAAGCGQCLPAHHHSYRHPALTACVPPALKKAQHTSHNPSEPIPNPPQASQTQHTTATCRRCLPASHHSSYKVTCAAASTARTCHASTAVVQLSTARCTCCTATPSFTQDAVWGLL